MLILGFADYTQQASQLANALALPYGEIHIHHFPDGENKVTAPKDPPAHVAICRSLNAPNDKLVELLLAARTLRQQGVSRLTLVCPYLCYMRQDSAFHPGEAISQPIIGEFIGSLFDDVVTVDPHLHRISRLEQAIPNANAITLNATDPIGDFLRKRWDDPLLIGPDSESEQWVKAIADRHGLEYGIASKERFGDRDVRVTLTSVAAGNRHVVLVDDIASTGRTLIEAAEAVGKCKPRSIQALVTHALFDDQAQEQMRRAGIEFVGSTDSVIHPSNTIELTPLLADALRKLANSF